MKSEQDELKPDSMSRPSQLAIARRFERVSKENRYQKNAQSLGIPRKHITHKKSTHLENSSKFHDFNLSGAKGTTRWKIVPSDKKGAIPFEEAGSNVIYGESKFSNSVNSIKSY